MSSCGREFVDINDFAHKCIRPTGHEGDCRVNLPGQGTMQMCNSCDQLRADLATVTADAVKLTIAGDELHKDLTRAEADNARMREALKPFARIVDENLFTSRPDTTWLWKPNSSTKELPGIKVRDVLNAKAALEPTP